MNGTQWLPSLHIPINGTAPKYWAAIHQIVSSSNPNTGGIRVRSTPKSAEDPEATPTPPTWQPPVSVAHSDAALKGLG